MIPGTSAIRSASGTGIKVEGNFMIVAAVISTAKRPGSVEPESVENVEIRRSCNPSFF
jgi:hypothetical protein